MPLLREAFPRTTRALLRLHALLIVLVTVAMLARPS